MKILSWNVNGIRAVVKKGAFEEFIKKYDPDILCLQETKAEQGQAVIDYPQYKEFWNSSRAKKGYSGTAIFSKIEPLNVVNDIPEEFVKAGGLILDNYGHSNDEGRVIAAEFDDFYVVTAYTPNAKDDLTRLPLRQQWDKALTLYCQALQSGKVNLQQLSVGKGLDEVRGDGDSSSPSDLSGVQGNSEQRTEAYSQYAEGAAEKLTQQSAKSIDSADSSAGRQVDAIRGRGKPVIYCGDMNVAHTEDDLANPKPNKGKKGFTDEERSGFDAWLAAGFIDTLRIFKQGNGYYTWWSHFANARARNVGWRIDYFLVSEDLKDRVKKAQIHAEQMGSDHCPISIEIDI
jgi:exodeoxyribonuclease-3